MKLLGFLKKYSSIRFLNVKPRVIATTIMRRYSMDVWPFWFFRKRIRILYALYPVREGKKTKRFVAEGPPVLEPLDN